MNKIKQTLQTIKKKSTITRYGIKSLNNDISEISISFSDSNHDKFKKIVEKHFC